MVLTSEGFFEVAIESVIWTHDHWIPFRRFNQLSYQVMSYYQATCMQSQFCTTTPISSFVQASGFIVTIAFASRYIYFNQNFLEAIIQV